MKGQVVPNGVLGGKEAWGRLKSGNSIISTARPTSALAEGLDSKVQATCTFIFTAYPANPVINLLFYLLLRSLLFLQ